MKGVILAGGEGTRLRPLTVVVNKHLLPVYNKPVIYYAIEKMVQAGIDRIMIVTSPEQVDNYVKLIGSGQQFTSKKTGKQIQIVYGIQNKPSGIADGLYIAKDYVGDDSCVLYLGDNIFEDDIADDIINFKKGALVFLKEVQDPKRFGVATIDGKGHVTEIVEKPTEPRSNLAVTGLYVYDNTVFDKMKGQPRSARGEYEITYINNAYVKEGTLRAVRLQKEWFDIGAVEALHEASVFMKSKKESRARSLSIFFPCYNDKGTIGTLVLEARKVAESLTDDYEIIVIDDGSTDGSRDLLLSLKEEWPELKLVFHEKNRGYGGALQSGFSAATKELVAYTDGDAQYDISELPRLWNKMSPDVDVVNGYKIKRHDPLHRIIIGYLYQWGMKIGFLLAVRDVDCDFRLIRRKVFDTVELHETTGTVTIELVKKIQQAGFRFTEVGVSHRFRMYGTSQFFNFKRVFKTLWRLTFLWVDLMLLRQLERPAVSIVLRRIVEGNFSAQKTIIRNVLVPVVGDGTVLDLGCGTGEFSPLFPSRSYRGVDIDQRNITYARAHYPGKDFSVADARRLPFADGSFDAAFVVGVLHHLSGTDAQTALSELRRVVKKNGTLLVMEDTVHPNLFSRLIHAVDRGGHIRTVDEWGALVSPLFRVKDRSLFLSGMGCAYSSFTLINEQK